MLPSKGEAHVKNQATCIIIILHFTDTTEEALKIFFLPKNMYVCMQIFLVRFYANSSLKRFNLQVLCSPFFGIIQDM